MSNRRIFRWGLLSVLLAVLIWSPSGSISQQNATLATTALTAGRNVNMVAGDTLPYGDPWLQRQNEPSIAVSTRNPLHLLAGANDYRTVDVPENFNPPGPPGSAVAGDAWLGVYKSYDGGESWRTGLLRGYPQSNHSDSPLKLYDYRAAADPVVRAAVNGKFFYAGIAFRRNVTTGALYEGALFVSRFEDYNNTEDDPIAYIDTQIVRQIDTTTPNYFIDKPWLAVDIPRNSSSFNVYLAYSVFDTSNASSLTSKILFARSINGGESWSTSTWLDEKSVLGKGNKPILGINQGAVIGIDPQTGAVYVAWRCFGNTSRSDAIFITKSTNGGATFSDPVCVANNIKPFDQGVSSLTFRTNTYPTIAIDGSGIVYLAWPERQGNKSSNIAVATSTDGGSKWSTAKAIEPGAKGHQFMPTLAFAAGKLVLAWYDQREDVTGQFTEYIDETHPLYRHTIDVRAAQADPGKNPNFEKSIQVSRYLFALDTTNGKVKQVQFNPPNLPMFKNGTQPFHGDYIDVAPSPAFVLEGESWKFNTGASASPIFHLAWTDNRDVRPPVNNQWANYTPPFSIQSQDFPNPSPNCTPSNSGMRNQNIYTARLTSGVSIGMPRNAKPLNLGLDDSGKPIPRAFVIYVSNDTDAARCFRLNFTNATGGASASFLEFKSLSELDVWIGAHSSISRTVFVKTSNNNHAASVTVKVTEVSGVGGSTVSGGYTGSIVINAEVPPISGDLDSKEYFNPNIINPNIINPSNPNIINPNIINWANPNIINPNIINPNIINPNIINPNIINPNIINPNIINWPNVSNPNIINPNIINPNIINPNIINPNIINPNIINPNIINPNIINPNIINASIADVIWSVENTGNTASSYTLRTMSTSSIPQGIETQLFVYKVNFTPQSGSNDCKLKIEPHFDLVVNITNPNIINPNIINPNIINPNIINSSLENATFYLGPGENIIADLRVIDPNPSQAKILSTGEIFSLDSFVNSIQFASTAQPVNSEDVKELKTEPTYVTSELMIGTSAFLPDGTIGSQYCGISGLTLSVAGGAGNPPNYTWHLNFGALPPGLSLSTGGVISGKPTTATGVTYPFTYRFVLEVADGFGTDSEEFYITIYNGTTPTLSISTASPLPNAVMDSFYGQTLVAVGGTWPRSWSVASGTLPSGLTLDSAGAISGIPSVTGTSNFTLRVTDSSATPLTFTKAFSLTVVIKPVVVLPTKLAFKQQPGGGVGGQAWAQQPVVQVQDADGHLITSDNTTQVTLTIENNPGNGNLSGMSMPATVYGGVATFTGLSIDKGGWNYTLKTTSSPTLQSATSETFNVEGFSNKASMSAARAFHTATYLFTDKILIAGGGNPTSGFLDTAELYDPATNGFEVLTMKIRRAYHEATPLLDGRVLITGGGADAELFDPTAKTFSWTTGTMNRKSNRATRLQDGRVLITGGTTSGDKAELYDPTLGTFSPTGSMSGDHTLHTSTWLPNGKVLITGGIIYGGEITSYSNTAELYDPSTGTFTLIGNMNEVGRANHAATLLNDGTVLITGGRNGSGTLNTAKIFNPANNTFAAVGPMNYYHMGHQSILLRDGTVLILGLGQAEIYDPTSGNFRLTGPFAPRSSTEGQRQYAAAAETADGKIFVCGGGFDLADQPQPVATTEMWNPLIPFPTRVISGKVKNGSVGVPGVLMSGLPGFPVTDQGGLYEGVVMIPWTGTVKPIKACYTFAVSVSDPSDHRDYAGVSTNMTNQDYITVSITGAISGRVTYGGSGVADVSVYVNKSDFSWVMGTTTDSSGYYMVSGLEGGNYKVYFVPPPTTWYVRQWYNDKFMANANVIPVTAGEITSNIDVALHLGGKISGTVTDTDVHPIQNIDVQVRTPLPPYVFQWEMKTDQFGNYSIPVAAGTYLVYFNPFPSTAYVEQWYNGAADYAHATSVSVSNETTTSGIDAILSAPPEIEIMQNMTTIPNEGSFNFDIHSKNSNTDITFIVKNTGASSLMITGSPKIAIGGTNSGEFSVQKEPASSISAGHSDTFIIRFSPTLSGAKEAILSIQNNDIDENPYHIHLYGTALDQYFLSTFTSDVLGQAPLTGGPEHPTSLMQKGGDPLVPVDGTILVLGQSNGISTKPVEINNGEREDYVGALLYDLGESPITSGVLVVEFKAAINNIFAVPPPFAVQFNGIATSTGASQGWLSFTNAGKIHAPGGIEVGTYQANHPFRMRLCINVTTKKFDVVFDDEMNGFADDPVIRGIAFNHPEIPNVGQICIELMSYNNVTYPQVRVAYDDIFIGYTPDLAQPPALPLKR